ncbi:hypothetical protein [Yinghuangia soli]|uniref:DUF2336 domain-containing protein n=1 Tax=Yinghuangia soli TaxID=2908204 RepID=A0AA41U9K1_9ACTN|nr:hypothetical protein [Yinghuangia soli]MCF2533939.1 hypothetical protein [Yinghuangia soli]
MTTELPTPADLVLALAGPDLAAAVSARLADPNAGAGEADDSCANCGSPTCGRGTGYRPQHDLRSAAQIVADIWGASAEEEEGRQDAAAMTAAGMRRTEPVRVRPQVLRGTFASESEQRTASLTPAELALRSDLGPDELASLLALDDPEVDARLFGRSLLDDTERRRLLDGIRSDGTAGPVGTPIVDLLWRLDTLRFRRLLPLAIRSGDPAVAEVVVGRVELQTESGRLRPIVAVWARHGAEAARRILESSSYPAAHAKEIAQALADPDGLDVLRARIEVLADPASMIQAMRGVEADRQAGHVEQIAAEGGEFPWPELVRAHAEKPLPATLHGALAAVPGCPKEMLLLSLRAGSADDDGRAPWLDSALEQGVLSPRDLVEHMSPAASALEILEGPAGHDRRARWDAATARADLGVLFPAVLGEQADAWVVAVRMVGQFAGNICELLDTAVAMTHVPTA